MRILQTSNIVGENLYNSTLQTESLVDMIVGGIFIFTMSFPSLQLAICLLSYSSFNPLVVILRIGPSVAWHVVAVYLDNLECGNNRGMQAIQ